MTHKITVTVPGEDTPTWETETNGLPPTEQMILDSIATHWSWEVRVNDGEIEEAWVVIDSSDRDDAWEVTRTKEDAETALAKFVEEDAEYADFLVVAHTSELRDQ